MKRRSILALSAVVGLGVLVPVWAQRTAERATTPEGMARNLSLDLREARRLLDRVLADSTPRGGAREREGSRESEANKRDLTDLLERSERTARDLENAFRGGRRDDVWQQRAVGERSTISDYQFNDVILAVRRAKTAGDERRIVQTFAQREYLTSRQLVSLLPVLDQSSNQEDAAVLLYPRLIDPDRFFTIREVLKSTSSWENILKRLGIR